MSSRTMAPTGNSSHLGSELVRQGMLTAERYQALVKKQALHGGAFDTLILEDRLIDYRTLKAFVSTRSRMPAIEAKHVREVKERTQAPAYSLAVADKFRCVPWGQKGDAVRVLTVAETSRDTLHDLADEVGAPVEPYVGLEFEYLVARAAIYDVDTDPRAEELFARAVELPKVIVDHAAPQYRKRVDTAPGYAAGYPQQVEDEKTVPNESVVELIERLEAASERDDVLAVLTDAMRAKFDSVILFFFVGKNTRLRSMWSADGGNHGPLVFKTTSQPTIKLVKNSVATYVGPLHVGGPEDPLANVMGSILPDTVHCFPVAIGMRVAAVAMGYNLSEVTAHRHVAALDTLARRVSERLVELILAQKEHSDGVKIFPAAPVRRSRKASTMLPARALTLLSELVDASAEEAPAQIQKVVADPESCLSFLAEEFPGPNWRGAEVSDFTRASDRGPLMQLTVALGDKASDFLVEKLGDRRMETRYLATLCAAQIRTLSLLPALGARVFDEHWRTREVAIAALAGYPKIELELVLRRVRERAKQGGLVESERAAEAIIGLRDAESVPALITALGNVPDGPQVMAALRYLTKQAFQYPEDWQGWWEAHHQEPRLKWLLDGLTHKDPELRQSAAEELRHLTGQYFGFHHDLPQKERDEARHKWLHWCAQNESRFIDD